ncbi:unannotated protein [freshwater metagenome]|uniref:Unannotated protein n=1 Tax=freshwater metagenome TaxID=449393 RepID=A0A6J6LXQ5_9ZZZZ
MALANPSSRRGLKDESETCSTAPTKRSISRSVTADRGRRPTKKISRSSLMAKAIPYKEAFLDKHQACTAASLSSGLRITKALILKEWLPTIRAQWVCSFFSPGKVMRYVSESFCSNSKSCDSRNSSIVIRGSIAAIKFQLFLMQHYFL